MSTSLVTPLNQSFAYIYCPRCRDERQNPKVMLTRDMHIFKCMFGDTFNGWVDLQRYSPDMVPESEIVHEQPNPQAMKWDIYVMPKVREVIERKFQGRVMTTIGTLLDCLADDAIIILQGSEVKELKKRGFKNGIELIAALESYKNMESERQQALDKLERMMKVLKEAGISE